MVGDYSWKPETKEDLVGFFVGPDIKVSKTDPTCDTLYILIPQHHVAECILACATQIGNVMQIPLPRFHIKISNAYRINPTQLIQMLGALCLLSI